MDLSDFTENFPTETQREYVVFGAPEAQARILTCFNIFFEKANANALFIPSGLQNKLTANVISTALMKSNVCGIAFARPQAIEDCPVLDQLDAEASAVQIVSAIRKLPSGGLAGGLFDSIGLLRHLKEQGCDLTNQRVLLVGAGPQAYAACQTAISGLAKCVDVIDPRHYMAQKLVNTFKVNASISIATGVNSEKYDVLINALELQNLDIASHFSRLHRKSWVIDSCLNASNFLSEAAKRGFKVYSGIPNISSQAKLYLNFFGENYCDTV